MKNTIKLASLLLSFLFLFSSCQAVYDAPLTAPETTANPEIDLSHDYFTTGMPYRTGNIFTGMIYEGCLIYIEECTTTGVIGEKTSPEGEKKPLYGDVDVLRIAKYNPVTGKVSSPCLIPTCNHSMESDCPMFLGVKTKDYEVYTFTGIFGDWMVYSKVKLHDEYGSVIAEIMYNLKTGELRENFVNDYGSKVVSKWQGGYYYNGKYYIINSILDYSKTGYVPGGGHMLAEYKPKTRQFLYEYDFETNESKLLFEVFEGWLSLIVTNERFYVQQNNDERFSIKKDGTDKKTETKYNSNNLVGTYAILYSTNGFSVYDMTTDESKDIILDKTVVGDMVVTERGVIYAHQTKYEEWDNFSARDYREEYPDASSEEVNNAARKILASGTAQIWECGYFGEDDHVIFELPAARIEVISSSGDYVFATVNRYNTETGEYLEGYKSRVCCINIKTGELTPIPDLEIVVPYWYTN